MQFKLIIQKNVTSLVEEIDFASIQDHLYEEGIISADDIRDISNQTTSRGKNSKLLRMLPHRGVAAHTHLKEALTLTNQHHLVEKLSTQVSEEELQNALKGRVIINFFQQRNVELVGD